MPRLVDDLRLFMEFSHHAPENFYIWVLQTFSGRVTMYMDIEISGAFDL